MQATLNDAMDKMQILLHSQALYSSSLSGAVMCTQPNWVNSNVMFEIESHRRIDSNRDSQDATIYYTGICM